MEIRYCCKKMYEELFYKGIPGEWIRSMLDKLNLKYCPFCGAKIAQTKLYEEI